MLKQPDVVASLADEIASRQAMSLYFGGMMLSLPNPDPVLKRLGKDVEVYREIVQDPAIKGATRRRRSAVVGLEYGLTQGQASDKVMKLCEQVLNRIKLRPLIRELHDASWFGYAPKSTGKKQANCGYLLRWWANRKNGLALTMTMSCVLNPALAS